MYRSVVVTLAWPANVLTLTTSLVSRYKLVSVVLRKSWVLIHIFASLQMNLVILRAIALGLGLENILELGLHEVNCYHHTRMLLPLFFVDAQALLIPYSHVNHIIANTYFSRTRLLGFQIDISLPSMSARPYDRDVIPFQFGDVLDARSHS